MPGIQLSEILENPEDLTRVLREEAVEKWTKHEILTEELSRLKETQAAHDLASMQIQKQENSSAVAQMQEYQDKVLKETKT